MTTTTKPKSGFFIGVGCPGCGGNLDLDADFFVLGCDHCGTPLRVIMPDTPAAFMAQSSVADHEIRFHIDRYLKQNDMPLTGSTLQVKRLYYPYWKVDATVLKLRNKTEVKKLYSGSDSSVESVIETDRSTVSVSPYGLTIAAGARMDGIPESLGMRSETVRVIPFADENLEHDFDALPVLRPWEIVNRRVHLAVAAMSEINPADFGQNLTKLFNPTFSLIYFPYFLVECYGSDYRRFVVDGLVGRVLKAIFPKQGESKSVTPVGSGGSALSIGKVALSFDTGSTPEIFHDNFEDNALARGVAHDLMETDIDSGSQYDEAPEITFGQIDVDFHRCTNCGSDLPTELSYVYICPNCHELQMMDKSSYSLPEIKTAIFEDSRPAKLVPFWTLGLPEVMAQRFGNLLGGLDKREKMFVPAIGASNFEAIHRLARRMSAAQGKMQTEPVESFDERYLPVRVGVAEALALAEMIICRELVDRCYKLPEEDLVLEPQDIGLVFVPFHLENYFYIDSVINAVSLERTLLD